MLNYLWGGMLLAGMLWGACNGTWNEVTQALLDSAKESVSLGLTMLGILSFWCGIMEIGSRAGLVGWLTGRMTPLLDFLFPELGRDHPAREPIAVNIIANMLFRIFQVRKNIGGHQVTAIPFTIKFRTLFRQCMFYPRYVSELGKHLKIFI